MFAIKLALAGLGHLIVHWGLGLIVIAVCLVIEFASGFVVSYLPILAKPIQWLQKYVLFVAAGAGLLLLGEWIGAKDVADRCDAKAAIIETTVDKAVTKAKISTKKDRWDTNQ